MSEKNQTVVDWLENKLAENLKHIILTQDHTLMASIFQEARKMEQDKLDQIRTAFGSCCRDTDAHEEAQKRLGELLQVEPYEDGSGHNFWKYKTVK